MQLFCKSKGISEKKCKGIQLEKEDLEKKKKLSLFTADIIDTEENLKGFTKKVMRSSMWTSSKAIGSRKIY